MLATTLFNFPFTHKSIIEVYLIKNRLETFSLLIFKFPLYWSTMELKHQAQKCTANHD